MLHVQRSVSLARHRGGRVMRADTPLLGGEAGEVK